MFQKLPAEDPGDILGAQGAGPGGAGGWGRCSPDQSCLRGEPSASEPTHGTELGGRLARAGPRCAHRLAVLTRFWKASCPTALRCVLLKRLEGSPHWMAECTRLSRVEGVQAQAGLPHPFWASPGEVPPVGWSALGRGFPCSLETRTDPFWGSTVCSG